MSTVAKDFTLDESAAFPLLFKCRPRARLRHLYTERTRLKVAEEMGKACSECSLSVSMSFALQIREITAPCQPVSQETRVREAESFPWYRWNVRWNNGPRMKSNIPNNTASSGETRKIWLWKLQTTLFINSKQCFSFTIRVIKNSNIVLSAISCWSDNGTESTAEVIWRYLASTIQEGAEDRRAWQRGSRVFVFPYLQPLVTTPKTDALYVLTVCRRGFCLFYCVFLFFHAPVVFTHPSSHSSPYLWRLLKPLTNNNAIPVGAVWWPTLHSLCVEVQRAYMSCAHKLRCKWREQKEGAAELGGKWKRAPL